MEQAEIDMFADLDQTLSEGLKNLCFTKTDDHPEIDVSCLESIKDLSKINGPAVRAYNLYKANKAFQNKEYLDSIYFETFAFSLFVWIKFHANKVLEAEHHMPTEENLARYLEKMPGEQSDEMFDFVDRFLIDMDTQRPSNRLYSIEFANGTELMELCSELPTEWTVIQLCKQVNTEVFLQTREEALKHPGPIFLTLLRYPWSERFDHQPIKIALNQQDLKELFESSYGIYSRFESIDYAYLTKLTDQDFENEFISKLKNLLGPWIVFFCGKPKSTSSQRIHSQRIAEVDQFLLKSPHKYSKVQNALISLIAIRIEMVSKQNIKDGALYISRTKEEWWELIDFFEELMLTCKEKVVDCYPVILVVDEHIDFMYWEMCNRDQEFTRVDSVVTLLKLYSHYQHNITKGYLNVNGKKGCAVLNPDGTLPTFTQHVRPFVESLPNTWNCLFDKVPTYPELRSMLAESDVHVYCGHGSGLQFISAYETCQLTTSAVVFLMGCSSVAFSADSGYCMGTAAHHYYHIAKSPAVIGHLNTTYVNPGAMLVNIMLGKWMNNVPDIDVNIFDAGHQHFAIKLRNSFSSTEIATKPSPYLTDVISQLRKKSNIAIAFRAILCYRGLPVRRA